MRAPARGGAGRAVGAEGPPPRAGAACRKDGVTRAAAGSRPPSAGRGQRSRSASRGEVSGRRGPGRGGASRGAGQVRGSRPARSVPRRAGGAGGRVLRGPRGARSGAGFAFRRRLLVTLSPRGGCRGRSALCDGFRRPFSPRRLFGVFMRA